MAFLCCCRIVTHPTNEMRLYAKKIRLYLKLYIMITWQATIKERGNDHILTPTSLCDESVTREEMIEFWGLNEPDVEWYKLEKINDNGKE